VRRGRRSSPAYLSRDTFFTVLAATVAGGFTMRSIQRRIERNRAVRELNERRSFSHVTDMLQVARCPTRLLCSDASGSSGASNETNVRRMIEYVSYGVELQSITAKVAAL
jgi:hypothetical protein